MCVYAVGEVYSEWTSKKLCMYVFLYATQSTVPHTGCVIVLLKLYKCAYAPSTSHSIRCK